MATASSEEHENRGKGRPRKSVLASLAVTVEGIELVESSSSRGNEEEALFCLAVPHRLLQQWRRQVKHPMDYIPLLNESIVAEAVVVKSDCDSVGARYHVPFLSYKKYFNIKVCTLPVGLMHAPESFSTNCRGCVDRSLPSLWIGPTIL